MPKRALVILSGGQDSTTVLFAALHKFKSVHCITFDYGQTHRIEIEAAREVVKCANRTAATEKYEEVTHEIISVPGILKSTSPLTDPTAELEKYTDSKQMAGVIGDRREKTFVPMRNALFLTIAANRAEVMGIKDICLGICQEDNANYDDCREIFRESAEDYINKALGHDHRFITSTIELVPGVTAIVTEQGGINVHAPLMYMSKAETVLYAAELPGCWEALAYTHTSYDGKYPPTDMNHANVLRAQGFEDAGLPDPLVLRAVREGRMPLPERGNYNFYRVGRNPPNPFELQR